MEGKLAACPHMVLEVGGSNPDTLSCFVQDSSLFIQVFHLIILLSLKNDQRSCCELIRLMCHVGSIECVKFFACFVT
jgi:hypothetical protein